MIKRNAQIEKNMQKVDEAKLFIEELLGKRQESFDNKSDRWKESEKGEEEESNISELEDLLNNLEECYNQFDNLFEAD